MFEKDKKSVVITRDVVWLKKDYHEWKGLSKNVKIKYVIISVLNSIVIIQMILTT